MKTGNAMLELQDDRGKNFSDDRSCLTDRRTGRGEVCRARKWARFSDLCCCHFRVENSVIDRWGCTYGGVRASTIRERGLPGP